MRLSHRGIGFAIAAVLCAVGCDRVHEPSLTYSTISCGEGYAPLPFAIGVANQGGAEGHIDRVDVRLHSVVPIPGPGLTVQPTEDFKYKAYLFGAERGGDLARPLPKGEAVSLPVDKTTDVWGALEWSLPDEAPPMLAACSVSVLLSYEGDILIETPVQAVMLQSRPGILENLSAARVQNDKQASEILKLLLAVPGEKSSGIQELVDHLGNSTP